MSESQLEKEIQEKGLTAPRITPADIDNMILTEQYHTFVGTTTTVCCITLKKSGFTVVGESACASPENFDEEIGKQIAFRNARDKIWLLEGYRLKSELSKK